RERGPGEDRSLHGRNTADRHRPVRRAAHRRHRDHRSADVPARAGARPHRRAPHPRKAVLMATQAPEAPPRRTAERVAAVRARPLFDPPIVKRAVWDSFKKLDPRSLLRNPVIFVVEIVSVVVTIRIVADMASSGPIAF